MADAGGLDRRGAGGEPRRRAPLRWWRPAHTIWAGVLLFLLGGMLAELYAWAFFVPFIGLGLVVAGVSMGVAARQQRNGSR